MNDLIALAMERAVELSGKGEGVFSVGYFATAFEKLAGTTRPIDGHIVRAMLTGRPDVEVMPDGSHYRLARAAERTEAPAETQRERDLERAINSALGYVGEASLARSQDECLRFLKDGAAILVKALGQREPAPEKPTAPPVLRDGLRFETRQGMKGTLRVYNDGWRSHWDDDRGGTSYSTAEVLEWFADGRWRVLGDESELQARIDAARAKIAEYPADAVPRWRLDELARLQDEFAREQRQRTELQEARAEIEGFRGIVQRLQGERDETRKLAETWRDLAVYQGRLLSMNMLTSDPNDIVRAIANVKDACRELVELGLDPATGLKASASPTTTT